MYNLEREIRSAIRKIFKVEVRDFLTLAPEGVDADYSTNIAMMLAREEHKAPMEIAKAIVNEIEFRESENDEKKYELEVVKPGFINVNLKDAELLDSIKWFNMEQTRHDVKLEYDEQCLDEKRHVITEFSDPNPFKVLHVGHFYTSVVGESISRLLGTAGLKVHRVNFGGDVGMHVAKTIWAMRNNIEEYNMVREEDVSLSEKAEFMAKSYVEGTRIYETDEGKKAEIVGLNKKIYQISTTKDKSGELAEMYWEGRDWSYKYFKEFYKKIGVEFEKYYPESEVADRGLSEVLNGLKNGVYEKSDGAVVFKGEKYGLHTRVFINKAGIPTYEAKDVGLSFKKWEDYEFAKSIIITGNDIIDYMKVVLKSIEEMKPELAKKTLHLTHGNVKLPGNEKMSSRKGNFLRAVDVYDKTEEVLREKYGKADAKIVLAAIKYAFLKHKIGGDIEFDIEESVSMTGNSGPYLQYATVRAKKILEKIGQPFVDLCDKNWKLCNEERRLILKILTYINVLRRANAEHAPHKLCTYLYELAQEFSRFYEKVPVVGDKFEQYRGVILSRYVETMTDGLRILGIEVPEEM